MLFRSEEKISTDAGSIEQEVSDGAEEAEVVDYEIADYAPEDYVTLGDYKGLEVEYVIPADITNEDVQAEIDSALEESAQYTDITDRGAEMGEWVNIDYTGTVDGEEFEGGTDEAYDLELGSNEFVDGFEDQLVGAKAGDTLDINVTFPSDYMDDTLAGKDAVFSVTVNQVYTKTLPEYNDDFVTSVSDSSTTTAEYEEEIRAQLKADAEDTAESTAQEEALQQAIANATVEGYPQDLYDACYDSTVASYVSYAEMFGLEYDDFMAEYMDMDDEDVVEATVSWVNEILVVEAIVNQEGMSLDDAAYQEKLEAMAAEYGYESGEEFEADYSSFSVRADILRSTVMPYLYENATVTQLTQEEYDTKYGVSDEVTDEE